MKTAFAIMIGLPFMTLADNRPVGKSFATRSEILARHGMRRTATVVWLCILGLTTLCAWRAAERIHFAPTVLAVLGILLLVAAGNVVRFCRAPVPGRGKSFELLSAVWTLALYLSLGAVPLLWRNLSAK